MNPHLKTLSHVGLHVSDFEVSMNWYTEVLGLTEAFRLHDDKGRVMLAYLRLSKDDFVELFAPKETSPSPLPKSHFAIEVEDIHAAVADLKTRLPQSSIRNPDIITGRDGSLIFNFFDPDGHRIEFMQFPPESQQAKALNRSK